MYVVYPLMVFFLPKTVQLYVVFEFNIMKDIPEMLLAHKVRFLRFYYSNIWIVVVVK